MHNIFIQKQNMTDSDSDNDKHQLGSLSNCVRKMYEARQQNGDVTIKVRGKRKKLKAHKFILMCRSKVLSSMLEETDDLQFRDIREDTFKQFLE